MPNLSSLSKALVASAVTAGLLALSAVLRLLDAEAAAGVAVNLGLVASVIAAFYAYKAGSVLRRAGDVCRAIAKGDFESRIIDIRERGDLGALMWSINSMIDRCDAYVRESAAAMQAVRANKYYRNIREEGLLGSLLVSARTINAAMASIGERIKAVEGAMETFEGSIRDIVENVSTASGRMGETATTLSAGAGQTSMRAAGVAAATEEATANIQSVAAACAELTASAEEVGNQVGHSADLIQHVVARAADAERTIGNMTAAGQNIAKVAGLIRVIAAQTNLLALNATVEAARAGEAGKGFAVVASEVKSLALQTASATGQIDAHIAEVQNATRAAVEAIAQISGMISDVNQVTSGIAETVQAQTLATTEIASNIENAFAGFRDISANIHGVTENASQTEGLAKGTQEASMALSAESQRLAEQVRAFIMALRSGPLDRRHEEHTYRGRERRAAKPQVPEPTQPEPEAEQQQEPELKRAA